MSISLIIGIIFIIITILLIIYKLIKKHNKINIFIIISIIISICSFGYVFIPYIDNNVLSKKEREAVCSNYNTIVIYLDESGKKTHIKEVSHSNNSYLSDYLCEETKKIAYYYDKKANVECNGQNYISSYFRSDFFDKVIEYYENNNYKCMIYNNETKENENIILGTWCGDDRKYEFNEDGTMVEYLENSKIFGYYNFNGESLDIAYKFQDYYMGIIKEEVIYNKDNNTLTRGKRSYNKCD